MAAEGKLTKNPVVVLREEFDDWALLYNPDNAQAVGVNPVGVAVWKMLDGKSDVSQIADCLRSRFEGAPSNVEEHVSSFLDDLEKEGFVGRVA